MESDRQIMGITAIINFKMRSSVGVCLVSKKMFTYIARPTAHTRISINHPPTAAKLVYNVYAKINCTSER